MSINWEEHVISTLKDYRDLDWKISVLRFQMSNPPKVSSNEMIEAMSFAHGSGEGRTASHISDKTMYIALNYLDRTEQVNAEARKELAERLIELEREKSRILHYISLLDKRQSEVIRIIYIEGQTQEKAAEAMKISVRSVQGLHTKAIKALAEMYRFAEELK